MLKVLETEIVCGASEPFSLLHLSDTHLCRADMRNGLRKVELAIAREKVFPGAEEAFLEAKALAKREGLTIVHTGDLTDFVSEANLEEAARFTAEYDCFFAAGNHEFSLYVGEAFEDAAYRNQSLERVQKAFTNDIRFSTRVMGGVKLVAIDNSYGMMEAEQLERLKTEVSEGLPVLLLLHAPLYSEEQLALCKAWNPEPPYWLMAAAPEVLATYSEFRRFQQTPDEATLKAYEYILSEPRIKGILAGHIHFSGEAKLTDCLKQWTVGLNEARIVRIR